MDYTPKLTDQMVMDEACATLAEHLPLRAEGYVCTSADLWQLLLGISAKHTTLQALCDSLQDAPSAAAVRGYLNAQLTVERLGEIERGLNAALAAQVPRRVFKKARDTAVDYHEQAYYGTADQARGLWVQAQAKDGTTRFYRVATAYVVWKAMRVTLALRFVRPTEDTVRVLADLLKRLKALKYRTRTLFLDRGFDGMRVMRFLAKLHQRAVIACTIRGKAGGTRALCTGRGSYLTHHTFASPQQGSFTARVAVCKVFTTARRTGRAPRRADWMLFILIGCVFTPLQVRQAYRRRFGIEASYRCARHARGWTTSPNPALRFVLLAVSFVLLNLWVALRWRFAQVPRRGGRWVDYAHLRLQRLTDWIARVVDRIYHPVTAIEARVDPVA